MSNVLFNTTIDLSLPFSGALDFRNTVIESYSGVEQVFNHTEHDRMTYTMDYVALTRTERDTIFDFIKARKGAYDEFRFTDPTYNYQARTSIGTGNASDVTFQITDEDGYSRWDIHESPVDAKVWVNNVLMTKTVDYAITYNKSGQITFVVAPGLAEDIEVQFYFDRRVRFTGSIWEWMEINYNNIRINGLKMREVLVNP